MSSLTGKRAGAGKGDSAGEIEIASKFTRYRERACWLRLLSKSYKQGVRQKHIGAIKNLSLFIKGQQIAIASVMALIRHPR